LSWSLQQQKQIEEDEKKKARKEKRRKGRISTIDGKERMNCQLKNIRKKLASLTIRRVYNAECWGRMQVYCTAREFPKQAASGLYKRKCLRICFDSRISTGAEL
jgi:hypothetical protein